jgi:hypothetical protein
MRKHMRLKKMNDEESRLQHIKDAEKILKNLESMKSNLSGGDTWKSIVDIRKKHIESFLKSLEV